MSNALCFARSATNTVNSLLATQKCRQMWHLQFCTSINPKTTINKLTRFSFWIENNYCLDMATFNIVLLGSLTIKLSQVNLFMCKSSKSINYVEKIVQSSKHEVFTIEWWRIISFSTRNHNYNSEKYFGDNWFFHLPEYWFWGTSAWTSATACVLGYFSSILWTFCKCLFRLDVPINIFPQRLHFFSLRTQRRLAGFSLFIKRSFCPNKKRFM